MQRDWNNEHEIPTIGKLSSQMDKLWRKIRSIDDKDKITEVVDKANKIISIILEGLKKGYYRGEVVKPILDLRNNIVLNDKQSE